MSMIGKKINEFKVKGYLNNQFIDLEKKDIIGKWSVLFFYPADFTFVCPTELEDLALMHQEFKDIGVDIYSVSCDTHFVHKAWHDSSPIIKQITYPMLADPTRNLAREFNVLIESEGIAERGTFIINPNGEIVGYEIIAGGVGRDARELYRKVTALQYVNENSDQVCPARWMKGDKTLKPSVDLVGKL